MVSFAGIGCLLLLVAIYARADDLSDFDEYLEKFGYWEDAKRRTGPQQKQVARSKAIEAFQEFVHLPVTGELDAKTKTFMKMPRCGVPDPKKRAGIPLKWEINNLNWSFFKGTAQIDTNLVKTAIRQAFDVWGKIVPLNFTEVPATSPTDLQFGFGKKDHGCDNKFDDKGGVLAHAFFPKDGRLHFDDDESWAFNDGKKIQEGSYTDLLSVAIHEIGHSLGLEHLSQEEAIMYPIYRAPDVDAKGQIKPMVLSKFDIDAIQKLYGTRANYKPPPPDTRPDLRPTGAACSKITAAMTGLDNATYFFNGNIGWKKTSLNGPANSATPFYVDRVFLGADRNAPVTAAVTSPGYSMTLLFQGRKVFWYTWSERRGRFSLDNAFPKDLPKEIPFEPEGAFVMPSGHIILFKGEQYAYYEFYSNMPSGDVRNSASNDFKFPAGTKTTFAADGKLYLVDANNYSVYDFNSKTTTGTKPTKTLVTC